jgi:hypothetical protein
MAKGTVLVNLKKDWFGPDGSLYQARDNPHEFPADYAEPGKLPEKEEEEEPVRVEVARPAKPKAARYAVLPSSAEIVKSTDTVMVVQNTGGGQQLHVPSAVEGDVKEVGGAVGKHGLEEPSVSVKEAAKVAEEAGVDQVGGKPRESGPLPAGTKKLK